LQPEGLERDIRFFFSLPIPKTVWNKFKVFQNDWFVRFIDQQISGLPRGLEDEKT
jgi:hypothetical protein